MKVYIGSDEYVVGAVTSVEANADSKGGFVNVFTSRGHLELSQHEAERLMRDLQEIRW